MSRLGTVVLFGGAGFIGSHLSLMLRSEGLARRIIVADIQPPRAELADKVTFVRTDVRKPIEQGLATEQPELIINCAAVHREPGHEPSEYYATNIEGARNVCAYATTVGCQNLVFTSSISVYGPTEIPKAEDAQPLPITPYGNSKLVAEYVHRGWCDADKQRRLVLVRPGVVFGPWEQGNVTRLVRAVSKRRFVYVGNQNVKKAGGYVKELCRSVFWALAHVETSDKRTLLYNFSMDPTPTLREFVESIAAVGGVAYPAKSIPFLPLLGASYFAEAASRIFGIEQPLHPQRTLKLVRSNNIVPRVLQELGYRRAYTLTQALSEWKQLAADEWA